MRNGSGLAAGFLLILVIVACTGLGVLGGTLLGSGVLGGFAGGLVGVVAGFWAVYRTYLVPLREASLSRDYSHLEPKLDDDD